MPVGMVGAFLAGWLLVLAGALVHRPFVGAFWPVAAFSSPGFLLVLLLSRTADRTHLVGAVAAATTIWGGLGVWGSHTRLDAPELGTAVAVAITSG